MNPLLPCYRCGAVEVGATETLVTEPAPGARPWMDAAPGTRHNILLTSNEPPLDTEVALVQSAISEADERLIFLGNEIAQLRDRLQLLEEEQGSVSRFRAQNFAVLSPLRRMPLEVLAEILSWTLPSPRKPSRRRTLRITESPWVLTHVSCHWRLAAIATPSLWSLVAVTYLPNTDPWTWNPLPMVETQISRAGHNLKIHFHGCETTDSRPQLEVFQCLAKHASRWEELSLTVTSAHFPLLASLRGRMPLLRRLWFQWDTRESQASTDSVDCFESAPSLVDVGVNNEFRFIPVSFPTQQLTRYDLDAPWDIHSGILKLTPNLREVTLTILFGAHITWPEPRETIELAISLPLSENNNLIGGIADLESSLVHSLCHIRSLCFAGCTNAPGIAEVLQKFRSIVEFAVIADSSAASAEIRILMTILGSEEAGGKLVAPQLCRLSFGCSDKGSLDYGQFLALVNYRWKSNSCNFKSAMLCIDLESGPTPDAEILQAISALREDGLDFVSLYGNDASLAMDDWLCYSQWN
ncbi:hypothetical protein DFH06DRAFT_1376373 [Mycena polygramma]|nr:hypothetical protein DFH06DRAFT_1376373 [Mycena polygramma]